MGIFVNMRGGGKEKEKKKVSRFRDYIRARQVNLGDCVQKNDRTRVVANRTKCFFKTVS